MCRVSEESKEGEEDVCVVNKLFREAGVREKKVDGGNGKKKEKLDYYYDYLTFGILPHERRD